MSVDRSQWAKNGLFSIAAAFGAAVPYFVSSAGTLSLATLAGGLGLGGATAGSGVLGGLLANAAHDSFKKKTLSAKSLLDNHDLHLLTGQAVALVIERTASLADRLRDEDKTALAKLGPKVREEWGLLSEVVDDLRQIPDSELSRWYREASGENGAATALNVDVWRISLRMVSRKYQCGCSDEALDTVAIDLVAMLPIAVRELLKKDFSDSTGGHAFAGFVIKMLGEILGSLSDQQVQAKVENEKIRSDLESFAVGISLLAKTLNNSLSVEEQRRKEFTVALDEYVVCVKGMNQSLEGVKQAIRAASVENLHEHQKTRDLIVRRHSDATRRPIPFQLPARKRLYGRTGVTAKICDKLRGGKAPVCGAWGMVGVGKTALMVEIAYLERERYPDGILLFDMQGFAPRVADRLTALDVMTRTLRIYGVDAKIESDAELRSAYRSCLFGRSALLIIDNVRDGKQIQDLMPPDSCNLLVTSREKLDVDGCFENLDELPRLDSIDLLHSVSERLKQSSHSECVELAEQCGDLPLALEIAAAGVEATTSSLAEFLEDLADLRKSIREDKASMSQQEMLLKVTAAVRLSVRTLGTTLRDQWAELSIFPADFDRRAAASMWGEKLEWSTESMSQMRVPRSVRVSLDTLCRRSLLYFNFSTQRYRMHDLVRDVASGAAARRGLDPRGNYIQYYSLLLRRVDDLFGKGGDSQALATQLFDADASHVCAAFDLAVKLAPHDENMMRIASRMPSSGRTLIELRLTPRIRVDMYVKAEQCSRAQSMEEAENVSHQGIAYFDQGEYRKALECHERAGNTQRLNMNRRAEAVSLTNQANAYLAIGQALPAKQCLQQAQQLDPSVSRNSQTKIAWAQLYNNAGAFRKAIPLYAEARAEFIARGNIKGVVTCLGNEGLAWTSLGNYTKAESLHREAITLAYRIGFRQAVAFSYGNLGSALMHQGRTQDAKACFEEILKLGQELGDKSAVASALGHLAGVARSLDDFEGAIRLYEESLAIAKAIEDRSAEGSAIGNLAQMLLEAGRVDEAIEQLQLSIALAKEIGDAHMEAIAHWSLGGAYLKKNMKAAAIRHMDLCVEYERRVNHPDAEMDAMIVKSIRKSKT